MTTTRSPNAVLATVCAASLTIMLATAAMNMALPSLVVELGASTRDLQWIVDGYNLTFAAFVLALGSLSDRYGRKGALLIGLALFGGAAMVSAQATTPAQLVAGQAVMGLGAAAIFPTTLSIISNVFTERAARARAIGIWGAVVGTGGGCGPLVGGALTEFYGWQSILYALAAAAVAVMAVVSVVVTTSRDPATPRIDTVGLVLSVLAVGSLVYTIIEAPQRGWLAAATLAGFGACALVFVLLVAWELRCREPMLDIRLFANPRFTAASGAVTFAYFALFGFIFLGTQYMQFVKGYSPFSTGLRILPFAGAAGVGAIVGTVLAVRIGNKVVVSTGLLMFTVAFAWMSTMDAASSYLALALPMIPMGLGLGLTSAPATEAIMGAVAKEKAGIGSAMNDATREFGGTLGVAVAGSVFASLYVGTLRDDPALGPLPAQARELATESIGAAQLVAAQLPDPGAAAALVEAANTAFVDGFTTTALAVAVVTFVGAVLTALFLPARPTVPAAEEIAEEIAGDIAEDVVEDGAEPAPAGGSGVGGRVRNSLGQPLAGATVTLTDLDARHRARTHSDGIGHYWLPVVTAGSYVAIVSTDGHDPQIALVAVNGHAVEYDFALPVRIEYEAAHVGPADWFDPLYAGAVPLARSDPPAALPLAR